jgi:hypothetical protein
MSSTPYTSPIPVQVGDGTNFATTTNSGTKTLLDVNVLGGSSTIFTKPYNKLLVLSKNDDGDPLQIKTQLNGVDVQLAVITYDTDGDLQQLELSDL